LPERAEEYSMAMSPATPWHRRSAFAVIVVALVAYGVVAPFARIPLPRIDSFIPTMMAIVFVTDLVTAVLLFGQFSTTGSRALLVLASGYLFSSLIAIPFALTFPGAFAPTGLLGAGSQSAAWLNVSHRFGLAAAIVGYALLIPGKHTKGSIEPSPQPAIFWSVAIVIIVVCALTSAVTAGHDLMPRLLSGTTILPLGYYANGITALTSVLALLLLWSRRKSILDVWLTVAVCALMMETALIALLVPTRFSVGFYATRLIPLVVSKTVLVVLLSETVMLHERLASAFILQRVIVEAAPNGILMVDDQGTIKEVNTSIEKLFGYKRPDLLGQSIEVLVPYRQIDSHLKLRNSFLQRPDARAMGAGRDLSGRRKDGSEFPVEIGLSPIERNGMHGVLATVIDISERKRAEEHQGVLMAELAHRVKNVLARVAVVVTSTREGSSSMDEFVRTLDGRIQSMASAHSLLSQSHWQGVGLADLVRSQLAPYATDANTISGPDVMLTTAATQALAMVLHELVTNAAKYGALSTPGGRVSVSWDRWPNGNAAAKLMIVWRELGGPPIAAGIQPGYGTSLIRELIPHELGGTVDLVLASDGARCSIEIPLGRG
jgi:PAS domain S-box-containing protein